MKKQFESFRFGEDSRQVIIQADDIIEEYANQGFDLTLRQLYYKFVARDLFPDWRKWSYDTSTKKWYRDADGSKNAEPNYKWLGEIITKGRLSGLIDWDCMVDRMRQVEQVAHWRNPKEILQACARQFSLDSRINQIYYIEVWVEKDALLGVILPVCKELDVPCLVCRGFVSQSSKWHASCRFNNAFMNDKTPLILYLGDHDPSGLDIPRDIEARLTQFCEVIKVIRIALTMGQIQSVNPPPSPAKPTDSRYRQYVRDIGTTDCWELDALEPSHIQSLIRQSVDALTNKRKRAGVLRQERKYRKKLEDIADFFDDF